MDMLSTLCPNNFPQQKGSIDFSQPGGICSGGWNFNPCRNCFFVPDSYWTEPNVVFFYEEPGPGCIGICSPLACCCMSCCQVCASTYRGFLGLRFTLEDNKVKCLVSQKHLTREEDVIVLNDVVDIHLVTGKHFFQSADRQTYGNTIFQYFEILHRSAADGSFRVCRTACLRDHPLETVYVRYGGSKYLTLVRAVKELLLKSPTAATSPIHFIGEQPLVPMPDELSRDRRQAITFCVDVPLVFQQPAPQPQMMQYAPQQQQMQYMQLQPVPAQQTIVRGTVVGMQQGL